MGLAYKPIKLTVEDFEHYDTDKHVELIDGDFKVSPPPSSKHQRVSRKIEFRLEQWVTAHQLGEVFDAPMDVVLSENDVFQPDLLFISKERLGIIKKKIEGPPDLIVEILSPNDENCDRVTKKDLYSKFGVREYWIVDPEAETIMLLAFEKDRLEVKQTYPKGSVLKSMIVKDFELPLQEIFD